MRVAEKKFRAMELRTRGLSWRDKLWGCDVFFNGVPVVKTLVVSNLAMWVGLWVTR